MSIRARKERKIESKLLFVLWIFFIFSSVFVIEYTKDYKTGITGFVVLNCSEDICDEGDVIAEGQNFLLNYDSVCEKKLKFEFADDEGIWVTDTSGNTAGNSPVEVNESDCNENGCSLIFTYDIYPGEAVDYKMRFNSANETLYLEDTSKDCPVYCGDGICEDSEDYSNCREDCLNKEEDYIHLDSEEKERYFVTNYDEGCEVLFLFLDFDGTNIKIKETENNKFYNIEYKDGIMLLNHTGMMYELLYNKDNDALYLKDTDTGCSYDCDEEGKEDCYNKTTVQKCQKDEYGYLRWEVTTICSGLNCVRGQCLSCTDECSSLGKRSCYNDTAYQVCGNYYDVDFDLCYEWGNITDCEEWYECDDGECVLECEDECDEENETGCFNNSMSVGECKDIDDDPCLEWDLLEECDSETEICLEGECKCLEKWVCGNWSSCVNGQQTRTCTDENNCGTTEEKPITLRNCVCEPEYVCGNWGECQQNNKQTRICRDVNCGEADRTETRSCTYVPQVITSSDEIYNQGGAGDTEYEPEAVEDDEEGSSALFWMMIVLSILILGGGIWFTFYEIKISKSNLEKEKARKSPSSESLIQLKDYAKKCMDEGFTKEQIKKRLLDEGWSKDMVGKIFKVI